MKNRNWFWGLFFIAAAMLIVVGKLGYLGEVNVFSLGFTILLVPVMIQSIMHVNFGGVFFSLAFIGIIYDKQLGIEALTPWPILITALFLTIGFSIIFGNKKRHFYQCGNGHKKHENFDQIIDAPDSDVVDLRVSFGSSIKYVNAENLKRADLSCSFGAMKVYFDRAHVGENGAVINIDASFSGIELYIPKTWKLVNNMNVSLAGVEEKNSRNVTEEVTVTLTGDIKFSGIEIIYV